MAKKQTKSISPKREVERNAPKIKNLQPSIKPKILELMAKEMSNLWTKEKLIDFLINCGIDKRLIKDSQIKWKIAYNVLQKLNISNQPNGEKMLFKIIEDAVHPLAHEGDRLSAEALLNKFSEYLSCDNYETVFDEKGNRYKFYLNRTNEELNEIVAELDEEKDKRAKEKFKFLQQPDNKEKISLLLLIFQLLMDTVEIFCTNPLNPTRELNNTYEYLNQQIWNIINDLKLREDVVIYNFNSYKCIFFNLFFAGQQYAEQNKELSWEKIKPKMNTMYGEIDKICQKVGTDNTIINLKEHKKLKDIKSYLSGLKKKINEESKKEQKQQKKYEYKGISIRNKISNNVTWKNITIRFLNSYDVKILVKNKLHTQANNEDMGCFCLNKKDKDADVQWKFLQELSVSGGECDLRSKINVQEKEKYRQYKMKLSLNLKKFFNLNEDPFYEYRDKYIYKTKFRIEPEPDLRGSGEIYETKEEEKRYIKKLLDT